MKKTYFERIGAGALIVAMIAILFSVFFQKYDGLYLYYDDATNQVLRFYQEMWESVRVDGLFIKLWDWSNFLGANHIASQSYYNLFSPFSLIFYCFDKEMIPYLFIWLNMLKLLLIGAGAYQLTGYYTEKFPVRLVGMIILTFNGWVFAYAKYLFMWDSYVFMIFILGGIEKHLSKKGSLQLVVSTALLGITNYYFLYMFSFVASFYFIFRYFMMNQFEWRTMIRDFVQYGICYLSGILLSMPVFLPSILNVMKTPRLDSGEMNLFASFSQISRYLSTYFSPPRIYGSFNGYLDYRFGAAGWNGGMSFYSLLITPLLVPQLLVRIIKKERDSFFMIGAYVFLSVLVCLIPVYYLFQGSLESRWFIIFVILNALTVCHVLDYGIDKKALLFSFAMVLAVVFGIKTIVTLKSIQDLNILNETVQLVSRLIALYFIAFILSWIIPKVSFEKFMIVCVCVEVVLMNPLCNEDISVKPDAYHKGRYDHFEAVELIKELDDSLYRTDVLTQQAVVNYPMLNILNSYNLSGFAGYHSVYNYEQREFIDARFGAEESWYFYNQPYKMGLKNLLANKYWVSDANIEVSHINPPIGYSYLAEADGVAVYQNDYPLMMVRFVDNAVSLDEMDEWNVFEQDVLMRENVFVDNPKLESNIDFKEFDSYGVLEGNGEVYIDATVGDIVYVIHNSSSTGAQKQYTLYNGVNQVYSITTYNDQSYVDLPIHDQVYNLSVTGDFTNVEVVVERNYEEWLSNEYEKQTSMIQVVNESNDYLAYQVAYEQDAYLASSIAFDDGWHVYVDGKEVNALKINKGFVGIYLESGEHIVEFKYQTPGLFLGFGFAFIGLVLYVLYEKKWKKAG